MPAAPQDEGAVRPRGVPPLSDEFDKELEELDEAPRQTTMERAMTLLPAICELAKQGRSKLAICKQFGLDYAQVCKNEKKPQYLALREAFMAVPPARPSERVADDPSDPLNLKRIQEWARDGVRKETMAALLKMSEEQFLGYVKNVPRIAEAIRYGEAEQEAATCAALSALVRDPEHKDHIRAVLALANRASAGKPKDESAEEVPMTPEQIVEILRRPLAR